MNLGGSFGVGDSGPGSVTCPFSSSLSFSPVIPCGNCDSKITSCLARDKTYFKIE